MSHELIEALKHFTPAEARERLNLSARELDAEVLQLSVNFNGQENGSPEGQALVAYVTARIDEPIHDAGVRVPPLNLTPELEGLRQWVCGYYRAQQAKYLTPELLEWARQSINEEEILAALQDVEAKGVVGIQDIIDGAEKEAAPRE